MVISLVYVPPFLAVERVGETAMPDWIVCHRLMQLAMKLVVAQLCRAKDHESIEGAECVRSENVMQFRTTMYHQLATSLPPHSESLGRCITGQ